MSKSEILANEIETKKIELLQDRINNNSKLINDLTNKLVADYCKQLDKYVASVRDILHDVKNPPTAEELDYIVMELPVLLYFCRRGTGTFRDKNRCGKGSTSRKI